MDNYFRTDLAAELIKDDQKLPEGINRVEENLPYGFSVEKIFVSSEAEEIIGKPQGHYLTVYTSDITDLDEDPFEWLAVFLSKELSVLSEKLTGRKISKDLSVLVVGLGNVNMTPDAVGPMCTLETEVTSHLKKTHPDLFDALGCCSVSAFSPGSMGQTGIETSELVLGAVRSILPDIVIAVDALAARSADRLGSTVQISDNGIHPGSGVGNRRKGITKENLDVPVIALGIPTVVDSSSLIAEALENSGMEDWSEKLLKMLDNRKNYFVAPKECDALVKKAALLFSTAVNLAFGIKNE